MGNINMCRYCGTRFNESILICPNPSCGKEFIVPHEIYMKQYARRSMWFGIFGILTLPVFVVGVILAFLGLSYARKAKSTALIILNLIPITIFSAFLIWLFLFWEQVPKGVA